jgi:uncharacterized protein with PQ loop repeat
LVDSLVLIGALITAISIFNAFPQAVRVWRLRTVEGLSLSTQALAWCSCTTWTAYGVLLADPVQIVANGVGITGLVLVVSAMFAFGPASAVRKTVALMVLYVIALGVISATVGVVPVVLIGSTLSIVFKLPQAVLAWRAPGGSAISVSTFVLASVCNSLWFIYGCLIMDVAVLATSSWLLAVNAFIIVRTVGGRAKEPCSQLAMAEA